MKRTILVSILLCVALGLFSYVADVDDFRAAKMNPAAMGVGNSSGISFVGNYDEEGLFEDWYSIYFSSENFAYVLDRVGDDNFHTLAISESIKELIPNLYIGSSWSWENDKFKDGEFSESMLYRPTNFLSIGVVAKSVFNENRNYDFGIGLRPLDLMGLPASRLTLTADINYDEENFYKPILGVETELVDGINLGTSYDMDAETFGATFGIALANLKIGGVTAFDENDEFGSGQQYIHISEKAYRSVFTRPKMDQMIDYKLKGNLLEKNQSQKIGPLTIVFDKGKTISDVIKDMQKLKENDKVKGILFKSGNFGANFAQRIELKNAILDFKSSGKKVAFYYETITGSNYAFAASIADMIYLNPIGMIDLKGLAINVPYFKNLLDTLGIDVVNLRSHKYKTAGNSISEDHMTDAERETYELLLEDIYTEIAKMIEDGRGDKLKGSIDDIIDNGPFWDAERALELGLIDGVIYEDELEAKIKEEFKIKDITNKFCSNNINYDWSIPKKEKIALIYAIGNIHSGEGIPGKSIGSKTTAKAIKKAREDKSIKGIIIRVDSGGGSAIASDIIAREVELCKIGKNKKPVIVSMGGAAASGGYYIAAFADKIIAQPTTITGSIGVIGIYPVMERLYDKVHVNWETVKIGKRSDIGSLHRQPTQDEKKLLLDSIEHFYERFIGIVADGRNLERDTVHEIAQGRVWTGKQAFKRKLVDMLGGMDLAAQEIKKLANLKHEIELVEFDGKDSKNEIKISMKAQALIPQQLKTLLKTGEMLNQLSEEQILMILPVSPEIK